MGAIAGKQSRIGFRWGWISIVLGPDDKKMRVRPPGEFRMTRERRVPRIASVDGWVDVGFIG